MRALVVYESMFGNTHTVAEGIAAGLRSEGEVRVVPVSEASEDALSWADLVIVGGPTHVHGMTRPTTRTSATETALKPDSGLTLDPDAGGAGLREWFASLGKLTRKPAAAFDTRVDGPALITGQASGGIARELSHHGFALVAKHESFLVDRQQRARRPAKPTGRSAGARASSPERTRPHERVAACRRDQNHSRLVPERRPPAG